MPLSLPDMNLSEEQREFRHTLRRFFEEHAPMTEVRRVMESDAGVSEPLWKLASQEMGLAGLAIPEQHGGQGFGLGELALAFSEAGRCLAPIPLFASAALAARAIEAVADPDAAGEFLEPIASGSIATLAWVEPSGEWSPGWVTTTARADESEAVLEGEKCFVLEGREAQRYFVVARAPGSTGLDGLGLFAVDAGVTGVSVESVETLDPTRKMATIRFDGVRARRVGESDACGPDLLQGLEEATALLCAEMAGGMEKVLETAVDYANERYQFGRPIGSFQAIKHKCADMLIDFEGGRTAANAAVEAAVDDEEDRSLLASVAKAHCGPAYSRMATDNVQIHGGVGYTWEYDAHLFFRRAKSSERLLGDAAYHRERIARILRDECE